MKKLIIAVLLLCSINGCVYAREFKKLDKDKGEMIVKYVVKKEDLLRDRKMFEGEIISLQQKIAEIDVLIEILDKE